MRLLLCSPTALSADLGASKVLLELAESLDLLGCDCHVVSLLDLAGPLESGISQSRREEFLGEALRTFLRERGSEYDVVDFDHEYLPFPRRDFPPGTLMVARSALLLHHVVDAQIPDRSGARAAAGRVLKGRSRARTLQLRLERARRSIREADLVNVNNTDAMTTLVQDGVSRNKIAVLPLGLSEERRRELQQDSGAIPSDPTIAFIGTFDPRKGSEDFPDLVAKVRAQIPDVQFRLLGARGMFRTEREVLRHFPRRIRSGLLVVPDFRPAELPRLLAGCSVGVFPSYAEGFGLGILEMLAASLPVVAYRCPGPPMMLTDDLLVPVGDVEAMAAKVIELLSDATRLRAAREWARFRSGDFLWEAAARATKTLYENELRRVPGSNTVVR